MASSKELTNLVLGIFFLLVALAALPPFVPGLFLLGGLSILDPAIILVALVLIINFKTVSRNATEQFLVIAAIGVMAIVSALANSQNGLDGSAIGVGLRYIYFSFLVLTIVAATRTKEHVQALAFLTFFVVPAGLVFWAWIQWNASPRYIFGVPMLHLVHEDAAIQINRNYLGFFISIAAAYSVSFAVEKFNFGLWSILRFLVASGLVVSVFLTFSKGAWLAAAMGALAPYFVKNIRYLLISFGVVLSLASGFLMVFPEYIDEIYYSWVGGSGDKNTERFEFAIQGMILAAENPLFGVGPGNYETATITSGFVRTSDPHNAIVWLAAEFGIAAGLLFSFAIAFSFLQVVKLRKIDASMSAPFLAALVALILNIPVHGLPASMRYFYVISGCLLAINALNDLACSEQYTGHKSLNGIKSLGS